MRYTLPSITRPALPERCSQLDLLAQHNSKLRKLVTGSVTSCFVKAKSTTGNKVQYIKEQVVNYKLKCVRNME